MEFDWSNCSGPVDQRSPFVTPALRSRDGPMGWEYSNKSVPIDSRSPFATPSKPPPHSIFATASKPYELRTSELRSGRWGPSKTDEFRFQTPRELLTVPDSDDTSELSTATSLVPKVPKKVRSANYGARSLWSRNAFPDNGPKRKEYGTGHRVVKKRRRPGDHKTWEGPLRAQEVGSRSDRQKKRVNLEARKNIALQKTKAPGVWEWMWSALSLGNTTPKKSPSERGTSETYSDNGKLNV
jgi:hypothetical protein